MLFFTFYNNYLEDNLDDYKRYNKKFNTTAMLKSNNATDINTVKNNFKSIFNFKNNLTKDGTSKEKHKTFGGFSKLDWNNYAKKYLVKVWG